MRNLDPEYHIQLEYRGPETDVPPSVFEVLVGVFAIFLGIIPFIAAVILSIFGVISAVRKEITPQDAVGFGFGSLVLISAGIVMLNAGKRAFARKLRNGPSHQIWE